MSICTSLKYPSVFFLLVYTLSGSAIDFEGKDECVAFTQEYAKETEIDAEAALKRLQKDIKVLKDDFNHSHSEQINKIFNKRFESITESKKLKELYTKYISSSTELIRNIPHSELDRDFCGKEGAVEDLLEGYLIKYKWRLEHLLGILEQEIELFDLDDDEGIAVIAIVVEGYLDNIELQSTALFGGMKDFGPLRNQEYFNLIKLKQGKYYWGKMKTNTGRGYRYHDMTDKNFSFNIESGKLNYTGVFLFEKNGNYASGVHQDRLAIILGKLEQDYADFMDIYPMVNNLYPHDPFLKFYLEEVSLKEKNK